MGAFKQKEAIMLIDAVEDSLMEETTEPATCEPRAPPEYQNEDSNDCYAKDSETKSRQQ